MESSSSDYQVQVTSAIQPMTSGITISITSQNNNQLPKTLQTTQSNDIICDTTSGKKLQVPCNPIPNTSTPQKADYFLEINSLTLDQDFYHNIGSLSCKSELQNFNFPIMFDKDTTERYKIMGPYGLKADSLINITVKPCCL